MYWNHYLNCDHKKRLFYLQTLLDDHAERRRALRQLNTTLEYLSEEAEDLYEQELQEVFESEGTSLPEAAKEPEVEKQTSSDRREALLQLRKKGEQNEQRRIVESKCPLL